MSLTQGTSPKRDELLPFSQAPSVALGRIVASIDNHRTGRIDTNARHASFTQGNVTAPEAAFPVLQVDVVRGKAKAADVVRQARVYREHVSELVFEDSAGAW